MPTFLVVAVEQCSFQQCSFQQYRIEEDVKGMETKGLSKCGSREMRQRSTLHICVDNGNDGADDTDGDGNDDEGEYKTQDP